MSFANALENALLDHVLGNTTFTQPTTVYVALHTADPGEDCDTGEVTGGSYARVAASFGAASGGTASNDAAIEFTGMPAATVTHFSLHEDSTGTLNPLGSGALTASKTTAAGDALRFAVGELDVSLD